jgi:hypothetical protein
MSLLISFCRDKQAPFVVGIMLWLLVTAGVVHGIEPSEKNTGNDRKDLTIDKPPSKTEQVQKPALMPEGSLLQNQESSVIIRKRTPIDEEFAKQIFKNPTKKGGIIFKTNALVLDNPRRPKSDEKELGGGKAYPQNYLDGSISVAPRENSFWHSPSGQTFHLGEYLGSGRYAEVYRLRNKKEQVIKIYRWSNTDVGISMIKRLRIGDSILKVNSIRQLPILETSENATMSYVIQAALTDEMMMFTSPLVWSLNACQNKQEAVLDLYAELSQAGVVWEDGHLGNLFFKREGRKWVAGILDQDLLWQAHKTPQPAASTGDTVFLNEHIMVHQWIRYDAHQNKSCGSALNIELVRAYFPNVDRHIHNV